MVPVVLLVDHELSVRRAAAEELEVAGLHVLEGANADDALRLLREQSDDVQVLVTDVDMRSATSGISLAVETTRCRARSHRPGVWVNPRYLPLMRVASEEENARSPPPLPALVAARRSRQAYSP